MFECRTGRRDPCVPSPKITSGLGHRSGAAAGCRPLRVGRLADSAGHLAPQDAVPRAHGERAGAALGSSGRRNIGEPRLLSAERLLATTDPPLPSTSVLYALAVRRRGDVAEILEWRGHRCARTTNRASATSAGAWKMLSDAPNLADRLAVGLTVRCRPRKTAASRCRTSPCRCAAARLGRDDESRP